MPGYVLHLGATVMCAHAGTALPTVPSPRVKVMGQPAVLQSTTYTIAGCSLSSVPSPPCVTAQWTVAAVRVKSMGTPLVLQDSVSLCTPTGTPLQIVTLQMRVKGT
jgi:hypothetical protein